jgi:hypothetical protein
MRWRRPSEPPWVRRVVTPDRIERGLASAVAVLTAGVVVAAGIGLVRERQLDRLPDWVVTVAGAGVVLVAVLYGRWLGTHLWAAVAPHWRLTPEAAGRLVPWTVVVLYAGIGFGAYESPVDWALIAGTGLLVAWVPVLYLLERLARRYSDRGTGPQAAAAATAAS